MQTKERAQLSIVAADEPKIHEAARSLHRPGLLVEAVDAVLATLAEER